MDLKTQKKTHIHFAGDSWYWNWYLPFKSKELTQKMENHEGFPLVNYILNNSEYEYSYSNKPGSPLKDSVERIPWEYNYDYIVLFVSSPVRHINKAREFNVENYEQFMKNFQDEFVQSISMLSEKAQKINSRCLLVGGQTDMPRDLFEKAENKNLVLLSESILDDLSMGVLNNGGRRLTFKLATDWSHGVDETWDPKLVAHLFDDITFFSEQTENGLLNKIMYPDTGHLSPTSTLYLLDLIFDYIESDTTGI